MTDVVSASVWTGRSWWKACCGSCCLGLIVIVAVLVFLSSWYFGHGPQDITRVPRHWLKSVWSQIYPSSSSSTTP